MASQLGPETKEVFSCSTRFDLNFHGTGNSSKICWMTVSLVFSSVSAMRVVMALRLPNLGKSSGQESG
jgi:hypothetical protein